MQFKLAHTEVLYLQFEKINHSEVEADKGGGLDDPYKLKLSVFPDSKHPDMFGVLFDIELTHQDSFKIKLHYLAWFDGPKPFLQEDIESPFALINAPAIAFPYLRSFISLLTLNAGCPPAFLPPINFLKMYEEAKSEKQ
ncbi:MAG: protein-export chaperone SecB [Bacteroidota bacterium]|uniref:protein-export chaperone SecB n=1 Tax=Runella sp. TaxID=1960881 RepID=UPI0030199C14